MEILTLEQIIKTTHSDEERREVMRERKYQLNKDFIFTDDTLKLFHALNGELLKKMHLAYDKIQRIKQDLDKLIDSGKVDYSEYLISGDVELICNTTPLIDKLTLESKTYWRVSANEGHAMSNRNDSLLLDVNWDYEMFRKKGLPTGNDYICFLTHTLFVDDCVLSLQDLTQLKEYEVVVNVDINI